MAAEPTLANDSRPLPGGWLVVGLLSVVGCLNYLDRVMLNTMRVSIKEAIPMTDAEFGALTTAFLWVYAVLSPVGGWCADRFSRSKVILISLAVWSAVTWATAYVQTYPQLLATRVLMGISEACYIPASLALIVDYHRGSTRSLATGLHMTGIYAGMMLGGMGGTMADNFGWTSGFKVFGAFGVVYAIVISVFLRDVPHRHQESTGQLPAKEALRALSSNRQLWLLALYWSLLGFVGWSFMAWMPTYLMETFHLSQTSSGNIASWFQQGGSFLGVLLGGAWADRWGRTNLRGRVNVPMIALIAASPFVFLSASAHSLWLAATYLVIYGLARGSSDANLMPVVCQVTEPRQRATAYGMLNLFACCVGGVATYLGGWLKDRGVDLRYFLMASAITVLLSGLLLLAVRPAKQG